MKAIVERTCGANETIENVYDYSVDPSGALVLKTIEGEIYIFSPARGYRRAILHND